MGQCASDLELVRQLPEGSRLQRACRELLGEPDAAADDAADAVADADVERGLRAPLPRCGGLDLRGVELAPRDAALLALSLIHI